MREDYIKEEVKKGNTDVRSKVNQIGMIEPPSK